MALPIKFTKNYKKFLLDLTPVEPSGFFCSYNLFSKCIYPYYECSIFFRLSNGCIYFVALKKSVSNIAPGDVSRQNMLDQFLYPVVQSQQETRPSKTIFPAKFIH